MAAASTVSAMADSTKTPKYPVVLSDALLGKSSKEAYTGIRYNHKPRISSDNTSATAQLTSSNKDDTFSLGIDDNGSKYKYEGVRTTKDGNYVLIFDPERQVFVLHRLDSLLHMNVTSTPDNTDVDSLQRRFPQLEVQPSASTTTEGRDTPKTSATKPASKAKAKPAKASSALRKPAAKKAATTKKQQPASLPMPEATKLMPPPPAPPTTAPSSKPKKKAAESDDEEEEDDDDFDDLLVEWPGGKPPAKTPFGTTFQPPPVPVTRRFSDFVKNGEEDDVQPRRQQAQPEQGLPNEEHMDLTFETGSADEEDDEEMEDVGGFALPSPVDAGGGQQQQDVGYAQAGDDDADGEDDDEPDLEADLEALFEADLEPAPENVKEYESDSDVSEED